MRVLIVEDDDTFRKLLTSRLQQEGWIVTSARDGREGLRLYHAAIQFDEYFDLLILDITMPRLNGIAVGMNVRNLETYSKVPRAVHVYLTGHDQEFKTFFHEITGQDLIETSFADGYFPKPVDVQELISQVTELTSTNKGTPSNPVS